LKAWSHLKQRLKRWLFGLLGKDPEAVVVTFCTGDAALCRRMADEVRVLVPDRRHFVATPENWLRMRSQLRRHRIGLAPVMLATAVPGSHLASAAPGSHLATAVPGSHLASTEPGSHQSHDRKGVISTRALRRAAYRLAPRKILAYNSRLERHHLRPGLASFLFWRGVPLDRIYLRPWWWPWKKRDRGVVPAAYRVLEGRPCSPQRRRIAVLAPYFPYPLAHGGAVRIFHLLREMAREFDVELFAFTDKVGQALPPANPAVTGAIEDVELFAFTDKVGQALPPANSAVTGAIDMEAAPVLEFCARVALVEKPRYREPCWSSLLPPEVHEFRSPAMRRAIAEERRAFGFTALQVEYTQLAEYGGDVLVEHDVTFDLFAQIRREAAAHRIAHHTAAFTAWWDWFRWHRFETRAVRRCPRVVVMSKKDAGLLGPGIPCTVIENGVDLERFRPQPEQPGQRLLFIGSFRHFPNVAAYRFFTERVWPLLHKSLPDQSPLMTLTVVGGPEHLTYWRAFADSPEPAPHPRIRLLGFVADVRPLYVEANLVIVPTTVSAGTNVKVLEAMAMQRAVVSTPSGCAGLGLLHGHSVWEAETPEAFAAGVAALLADPERRRKMALAAYGDAQRRFDWRSIGERQRDLLRGLTKPRA
jgi:glycosyltransferase involved in cell wall biosynthesis